MRIYARMVAMKDWFAVIKLLWRVNELEMRLHALEARQLAQDQRNLEIWRLIQNLENITPSEQTARIKGALALLTAQLPGW